MIDQILGIANQPIKMVIVSGIGVLILLTLIIFFQKVLKKNIPLVVLLFLITLLPLISILRLGTYESGDLSLHSKFAISFFESLKEGDFIPVWEKYMLGGFGYPFFQFIYPLPYYFASAFHFLGLSFISSFKLIASLAFIFSGFAMYLFVKEETKKPMAGLIAAIFYLFAPYHLIDLHFRFAIGETLAFLFLPLTFYFIKRINSQKFIFVFLSSLSFGAMVLSHQAISLAATPFLFFYIMTLYLRRKDLRILKMRFMAIAGGIGLTAYFWLPSLSASRFTYNLDRDIYFSPFIYFLFSPARFGLLYQGRQGELYFPVGYVHLVIFVIVLIIFLLPRFREKYFKKEKSILAFLIISFLISFFMLTSISKPIWEGVPILSGFQFSYRFSVFTSFFLSIIAGITLLKIKYKPLLYLILSTVILITILNWGNRRMIPQINDEVLKQQILKEQPPVGQGTTIWADADKLRLSGRKENISLVSGKAKIVEFPRKSTEHEYIIDVKSPEATFFENTLYFPGWNIEINGIKEEIKGDMIKNGLISFRLNEGISLVRVRLEKTWIQNFASLISISTLLVLLISLYKKNKT